MPDYQAAYTLYERTGNMAEVSRVSGINENSLRDYARRHGWKSDRAKAVASQQETAERLNGTVGRIIQELEERPTIQRAKLAREVARLQPMVGGVGSEGESTAQTYSGAKDDYRALLLALVRDAMRKGKDSLVGQYVDLLGKLDGHIVTKTEVRKSHGTPLPTPAFDELESLGSEGGPVFERKTEVGE